MLCQTSYPQTYRRPCLRVDGNGRIAWAHRIILDLTIDKEHETSTAGGMQGLRSIRGDIGGASPPGVPIAVPSTAVFNELHPCGSSSASSSHSHVRLPFDPVLPLNDGQQLAPTQTASIRGRLTLSSPAPCSGDIQEPRLVIYLKHKVCSLRSLFGPEA